MDRPPDCKYTAEVMVRNTEKDLAILRLVGYDGHIFTMLPMDFSPDHYIEKPVRIIGYPGVGGDTVTVTRGIISGFDQSRNLKTDAEVNAGNSGGGAFDLDGKFVGIPSFLVQVETGKIGFIIPVSKVVDWLTETLKTGLPREGSFSIDLFNENNIDFTHNLDSDLRYPRILSKFTYVEMLLKEGRYGEVFPQIDWILEKRPSSPLAYQYLADALRPMRSFPHWTLVTLQRLGITPVFWPS
jgi:hypothetical protein